MSGGHRPASGCPFDGGIRRPIEMERFTFRVGAWVRPCLNRQAKTKTIVNLSKQSRVKSSNSLCQERLIHRDDLRDIHYGWLCEPGSLPRKANVPRSVSQS